MSAKIEQLRLKIREEIQAILDERKYNPTFMQITTRFITKTLSAQGWPEKIIIEVCKSDFANEIAESSTADFVIAPVKWPGRIIITHPRHIGRLDHPSDIILHG